MQSQVGLGGTPVWGLRTARRLAPARTPGSCKIAHPVFARQGAQQCFSQRGGGVTQPIYEGEWLWRSGRTCAVACSGRLGQCCPEAKRGLMPRLAFVLGTVAAGMALRTPQNAGGGRGDASFVQNTTRTIASGLCLLLFVPGTAARVVLGQTTHITGAADFSSWLPKAFAPGGAIWYRT